MLELVHRLHIDLVIVEKLAEELVEMLVFEQLQELVEVLVEIQVFEQLQELAEELVEELVVELLKLVNF